MPRGAAVRTAVVGGLCLGAATPPAWFPGAECLVVVGLALWLQLAQRAGLASSYLLGCVHMAWFSWSVRHVLWPAYGAIVVLGGGYYLLGSLAVRRLRPGWTVPGFAVAVAGSCWLRSVLPEIHYPHGQPCHALWSWPWLLAPLRLGGEPLGNALLGATAAALVLLARSWRTAVPGSALARGALCGAVGCWGVLAGLGWLARPAAPLAPATVVDVAAVQPNVHPYDPYLELAPAARAQRFRELYEERLVAPVRELLRGTPPDLILWPESSLPYDLELGAELPPLLPPDVPVPAKTQLVVGGSLRRAEGATPAALQVGAAGRWLGTHEKQCLVPGGEFLPLVRWLPEALRQFVHGQFAAALGSAPDCVPGRPAPPLRTAAGVPFAAMICYDNAFPGPAAAAVANGAWLLCVLSNEAWYRGGGELTQLLAMTVCRAVELGVPIVRCTTDGWTAVVGADGRVVAELPPRTGADPGAQILRSSVPVVPVAVGAMAPLRAAAGPLAASCFGLLILHGLRAWAKLRAARTAAAVPAAGGEPPTAGRTGS